MKLFALGLLFATVTANECCEFQRHNELEDIAKQAVVCEARGGVAIYNIITDGAGHAFRQLTQCVFPCDQRLVVEK